MTDNQEIEKVEKVEIQKPNNQFNGTALVSMISGILTYIWLPITALLDVSGWLAIILSPISALVAVITGSRAKKLIRSSQGQISGKKMANAGLWLGWIYIIGGILTFVIVTIIAIVAGKAILSTISGWLG
jgi:hypothetical protein